MCDEKVETDYLTSEDLFDSPEPSTSFEDAREAYLAEIRKEVIDEVQRRKQEDWSVLGNLVVGAEDVSRIV